MQYLAWKLKLPLVTVSCHDDLSTSDLVGRYLIRSGEAVWMDGPLTLAVRAGAICYLDEIVEARKDTTVVIHPLAYVGHDVQIGANSVIHPQTYIGERVTIGKHCIIHAGAAIGCDGFGYLQQATGHRKIPQIGTVIIEDEVEVGSNSTIDRATVAATIIGAGTKIDDSVHIAHNCVIGKHCLFAGQVGIAGSTDIGDFVVMGGQAGINDHISICSRAVIGAQAGVFGHITEPGVYSGYAAGPHSHQLRILAATHKLPELLKTVRDLQRRIAELEAERQS